MLSALLYQAAVPVDWWEFRLSLGVILPRVDSTVVSLACGALSHNMGSIEKQRRAVLSQEATALRTPPSRRRPLGGWWLGVVCHGGVGFMGWL